MSHNHRYETARKEFQNSLISKSLISQTKFDFETMRIGYTRVSTQHQNLDRQIDALKEQNCDRIFTDKMTGTTMQRPGWEQCWDYAREGDELIVDSITRIGRNFEEMISLVEKIGSRGIKLRSLSEPMVDTTTSSGELIFRIMAAVAEWQRAYILETAEAGRVAAKARGRSGGRPRKLSTEQIDSAVVLRESKKPVIQICKALGISKATYYRRIEGIMQPKTSNMAK